MGGLDFSVWGFDRVAHRGRTVGRVDVDDVFLAAFSSSETLFYDYFKLRFNSTALSNVTIGLGLFGLVFHMMALSYLTALALSTLTNIGVVPRKGNNLVYKCSTV